MSREPKRMENNTRGSANPVAYIIIASIIFIVIISYMIISNIISANEEKRLAETEKQVLTEENKVAEAKDEEEEIESVSMSIGKTVEQSNIENTNNEKSEDENVTKEDNNEKTNQTIVNENNQEEVKELSFIMPTEGEIIRGYAKESLVYSETLQEWITHQAIDIKANSRDVVKASEEGKILAIKSDPRYGLTVIIEHNEGFKTVYSNLLTAEFVVEGEEVKQGQTIGTVGSSATFEISDEPHLHFEMLKDSEYVDPTIYIK